MKASGIDNGSHFNMRANDITLPWNNKFDIENNIGKSVGSPWNVRSASQRYNGYDAPVVTFQGLVDTRETALGSEAGGSLFVNLGRLGSFALAGSAWVVFKMVNDIMLDPFPEAPVGSIPCVINTVSSTMNTSYWAGSEYLVNYQMQLTLVSGPV